MHVCRAHKHLFLCIFFCACHGCHMAGSPCPFSSEEGTREQCRHAVLRRTSGQRWRS